MTRLHREQHGNTVICCHWIWSSTHASSVLALVRPGCLTISSCSKALVRARESPCLTRVGDIGTVALTENLDGKSCCGSVTGGYVTALSSVRSALARSRVRLVGGHPQAYATALRCAAKKTDDSLAAAYWFAEAARIHEAMDDLGGAIALLWRALECDRSNPRSRELLAAAMVRLSMRAGLGFTFAPSAAQLAASQSAEGGPLETGLRPPAAPRRRDTIPEVFGSDSEDPESERRLDAFGDDEPITGTTLRATLRARSSSRRTGKKTRKPNKVSSRTSASSSFSRPPKNPSSESGRDPRHPQRDG